MSSVLNAQQSTAEAISHPTARRILDAAVDQFQTKGYRETSVKDITNACELTPGALYVYFASKDALLKAVVQFADSKFDEQLTNLLGRGPEGEAEELCFLVDAYATYLMENQRLARVADIFWRELQGPSREAAREVRVRVNTRFRHVLDRGISQGTFVPLDGADSSFLSMLILHALNSLLEWWSPEGRYSVGELSNHFQQAALRLAGAGLGRPS